MRIAVHGIARPAAQSKWFDLICSVVHGKRVECAVGGKEIRAHDVARAVEILLNADTPAIIGETVHCYDRSISQRDVATIANELCASASEIVGEPTRPKHQIATDKLCRLGMQFGGEPLLRETIRQLIDAVERRT